MTVNLILLLLSFLCLAAAALGVPSGRVSLGWLGLALYVLSMLIK